MKYLKANKIKWLGLVVILGSHFSVQAFSTVEGQIEHYLNVLNSGEYTNKIEMLQRLQWSGLSDPRLYDPIEQRLLDQYLEDNLNKPDIGLLSHLSRALGYSGNKKYIATLSEVENNSAQKKIRKHARKAQIQLTRFEAWNRLIADSDYPVEGKDVEIAMYMKMMNTDDPQVQRLSARAIFHQRLQDSDLLALVAKKVEGSFLDPALSGDAQDAVAWMCKAIGQSGTPEYSDLLSRVVAETPHKKIRKHASKYAK